MALTTKERKVLTAALANKLVAESIADQIDEGSAGLVDVSSEELASDNNGEGASLVGIEDSGTLYTATDVEAALAEVKTIADAARSTASLALTTTPGGASYVGVYDAATIYTGTTVETCLAEVKVQANISTATLATAALANASPSATFNAAVGAKTLVVRKLNQVVSVYIPAGTTADGGGIVIASDAALAATFRPTADQTLPCIVTDNAVVVLGTVVVKTTGVIEFGVGAAHAAFTDDAAAGWPAQTITFISAS